MQAIKRYGNRCELCGYGLVVETHHILPRKKGGLHVTDNLTVLCPNCHALFTRKYLSLKSRGDIPALRIKLRKLQESPYPYFG
jgi:predicted restriction endonuclease